MAGRNFIVRFLSRDSRDEYVRRIAEVDPELTERLYLPERRPEAVVEPASADDAKVMVELIGPEGEIFGDAEFDTMVWGINNP